VEKRIYSTREESLPKRCIFAALIKHQSFMKKNILILIATCLLLSCSNKNQFQVSGTLTDFGNPDEYTMLYLKTRNINEQLINIDSTYLKKDGTFVLKGKSSGTDLYFLADKDNVFIMRFFVDPGNKIKVSGSAVAISDIKIEGSTTHDLYNEYLSLIIPLQEEQQQIYQTYQIYAQNPNIPEERLQYILEELVASYEQLEIDIENLTLGFIIAHPNSIVSAYLVYRNSNSLNIAAEIEVQLILLDPEMDNKFVSLTNNIINKIKQTEVGAVLPNIELPDAEGKIISLESLRGKYVLVDFWATWCGPCVREIPNLKEAYQNYNEKGFEIFSISIDVNHAAWLDFLKKHELSWSNVTDLEGSPTANQMAIKYIPHTFLLDPNGVIIAVNLREEALENKLAELMP